MRVEVRDNAITNVGRTETLGVVEEIVTHLQWRLDVPTDPPAASNPSWFY